MARITVLERQLRQAFPDVSEPNITLAVRLMRGKVENYELKAIPAAKRRIDECYHMPSRHDVTMHVLDSLLGTHGVESLGKVHVFDGAPFEYLNVGDPYTPTVVWYRSSGRYYVRCYGDIVESYRLT